MPTAPVSVEPPAPAPKPEIPSKEQKAAAQASIPLAEIRHACPGRAARSRCLGYGHPELEFLGRRPSEQVTDDAYVRGDLTPLSTKVAGIVRA